MMNHKSWRRIAKKERRRRLRRKAAAQREEEDKQLKAALEKSAEYLNWIREQESREKEQEEFEEQERAERFKLWLEEEEKAQKDWKILQEKNEKIKQQQQEQNEKIRQEWEAKQEIIRKKNEEDKRKRAEERRKQEELNNQINAYIDEGAKTPEPLREIVESQPNKELCPFFTKTGACRYGSGCSRNHRRVCLSKVILISGFYSHFSLEKNSAEYDTDISLEYETSEMRQHYRGFYKDVVPELESFGRIKTLKCCRNSEIHLRGNVYVEYYKERDAAKAVRKLRGRWYAGRQLNVEFANLKCWKSAICGMSKCPKGKACNFLHTFKNPHGEYEVKNSNIGSTRRIRDGTDETTFTSKKSEHRILYEFEEPENENQNDRNWRWSESPEVEIKPKYDSHNRSRHRSRERDRRSSSYRSKDVSDNYSDYKSKKSHSKNSRKRHSSKKRDRSRSPIERSRRRSEYKDDYDDRTTPHRIHDNDRRDNIEKRNENHDPHRERKVKNSHKEHRKSKSENELPRKQQKYINENNCEENVRNGYNPINIEKQSEECDVDKSIELTNKVYKRILESKWDNEVAVPSLAGSIASTESYWSGTTDQSDSPTRSTKQCKDTKQIDEEWIAINSSNQDLKFT